MLGIFPTLIGTKKLGRLNKSLSSPEDRILSSGLVDVVIVPVPGGVMRTNHANK